MVADEDGDNLKRQVRDPKSLGARLGSPSAVRAGRKLARASSSRERAPKLQIRSETRKTKKAPASAPVEMRRAKKKPNKAPVRRRNVQPNPLIPYVKALAFYCRQLPRQFSERLDAIPAPPRIHFVAALFMIVAAGLLTRAAQLQLIDGDRYRLRAEGQGTTERTIAGRRGRILDRHGGELANTVESESVFAERDRVKDRGRAARRLAPILKLPASKIERRLRGHGFVYLIRRTSPAVAQAVREAKIPGVGLEFEPRRTYGNVKLASHILGFVDIDGVGRWGVERTMQGELQGQTTRIPSVMDALRRAVWSQGFDAQKAARGHDVVLTIDRQVQYVAEEVLERTVLEHKANSGVAIVLDTQTSEVLALASYPSFNPNNLSGTTSSDWRNRAVEMVFDPGSTSKIVTVAAALESGMFSPESRVHCEFGKWMIGGRTIRDANHSFGELRVSEVLWRSSNIGAGKLGRALGAKTLHTYLKKFGFGQRTGIELPVESPGILRSHRRWHDVDLVNIAFGQGISATPMQMIQAANVIAAKGILRPPTLVSEVRRSSGSAASVKEERKIISERTAEAVTDMMIQVTSQRGTAPKAAIPGFLVAGKTGTAQKYDSRLKAYSRKKYVASFVGFVPAWRPRVTVLVLIDEPKEEIYGGPVAGPAFRDIAVAALATKELYPSEPVDSRVDLPGVSTVRADPGAAERGDPDSALERAVAELSAEVAAGRFSAPDEGLELGLSAEARALLGEALPTKKHLRLRRGAELESTMPNLIGLELGEALERCAALTLDPEIQGAGRVFRQLPPPGAKLGPRARCTLELRRDG